LGPNEQAIFRLLSVFKGGFTFEAAQQVSGASLQQLITLMAIAYDKERLENNLSTENIAHAHYEKLDPQDKEALKELIKSRTQKALAASREVDDDVDF
jgi:NADP-dependent 3-hydroxy acid dehydrogenase YdfG